MMFRTSALAFVLTMAAVVASGPLAAQDVAPAKKNPFRGKVALIAGFAEGSEKGASMRKFAAAYSESHASTFVFASKERPGAERFRVLDPSGAVVYEGGDDKEAEVAVVNTLTDMPVPGQLINGVALKKFKNLQKSFVMGKVRAEGSGLAPFKAALKSKKPGEAEEAQAILDSIEKAKANLEKNIADDLEEGDKGAALRDLNWFCRTWPSEKDKYDADYKRLSADPEAVKAAKALLTPPKRRR